MHILYQSFIRSIWWNTFESVIYNAILITHQWVLFRIIPRATYGLMGLLFSYIYLTAALTNIGFDYSIGSYWQDATKNKSSFASYIWHAMLPTYLLIILLAGVLFYSGLHTTYIDTNLYLIVVGIIAGESLKKSGKIILQLMFKNRITAVVDVLSIIGYISMVWGAYWHYQEITLCTVFVPLLIAAWASVVIFYQIIIRHYFSLPASVHTKIPYGTIAKQRAYSFLNTMMHQLFSGNILTPLFAIHLDLASIGIIKLISQSCQSVGTVIHNIFGLTAHALFANAKHMNLTTKQQFFYALTYKIHQILYAFIIFGIINYQKLIGTQGLPHANVLAIALYLVIMFSENFFIPYEKVFLTEEKSHYLASIQVATWIGLFFTIRYIATQSIFISLCIVLLLRILSYGLLSLIALRAWNIRPSWQIQPLFGLAVTVGSVLFFLWW